MAGLAFVCLEQTAGYSQKLQASVRRAVKRAKAKILKAGTPEGVYGNIYSTPLAVQVRRGGVPGIVFLEGRGFLL